MTNYDSNETYTYYCKLLASYKLLVEPLVSWNLVNVSGAFLTPFAKQDL